MDPPRENSCNGDIKHICLPISMTQIRSRLTGLPDIKTGRRANPAIDGPRDQTVCFMLSQGEKEAVDWLAACMNITRSGMLARIVAEFVAAAKDPKVEQEAQAGLLAYLSGCRNAVNRRGESVAQMLNEMNEK